MTLTAAGVHTSVGYFVFDRPLHGAGAYQGREQLLRSLVTGVLAGRSFVVLGGPKTGKSSTLLELASRLIERLQRQPGETKVVPVHLPLASFGNQPSVNLVRGLWRALSGAILDGRVIGQGGPAPQLDEPVFHGRGKQPWDVLHQALIDVQAKLHGTSAWCQQVVLVDDADLLLQPSRLAELSGLARLARAGEAASPLAMIFAGGRQLRESLLDSESALKHLRPAWLGSLKESEATALVRGGLPDMAPETLTSLLGATGRHPYVLQRLLAELETHPGTLDLEAAVSAAQPEIDSLCAAYWNELDYGRGATYRGAYAAPEHALMQLLIDYGTPIAIKAAEVQLGLNQLREYAELLEYEGLCERVLKADTPSFRAHFGLWNQWYSQRIHR